MMPQAVMPTMGGGGMGLTASGGGGGAVMRDMTYFTDMGDAEKHVKHCMAEIDFNNSQGATEFIVKAVSLF